jgi:hypothetical protein
MFGPRDTYVAEKTWRATVDAFRTFLGKADTSGKASNTSILVLLQELKEQSK